MDPDVQKQRPREEDTPAREGGAEEIVPGEEGSGVLWVGEGHVDEDALHDDEDGGAVDGDADGRCDPMDSRIRGPREEEETDWGTEGREEGGDETVFLGAETAFHDVRDEIPVQVGAVGEDADDAGDEDAGEDDADDAEGEVVVARVDEGEDFEEGVVDPVHESRVHVYEGDGGVFDGYFEGFDECVNGYAGGFEALLIDFRLRFQACVAG